MRTRAIPQSSEELPVIGMGTWQSLDVSPRDVDRIVPLIERFAAAGGRVIDTSPMYGRSEETIGLVRERLSEETRSALWLATKVWIEGAAAGERQMERSLARMKVDACDLIQIHNLLDWRTHLETLEQWKRDGRVRYVGVTHYLQSAFGALEAIMRNEAIDFVQLPYSASMRAAEEKLLPLARERGIAVLVNRPFEEGALLRRVRNEPLPDFAQEIGCTSWGELLLRFIVSHEAVTSVIPATANAGHLAANLRAGEGALLSEEQREVVARAVA